MLSRMQQQQQSAAAAGLRCLPPQQQIWCGEAVLAKSLPKNPIRAGELTSLRPGSGRLDSPLSSWDFSQLQGMSGLLTVG